MMKRPDPEALRRKTLARANREAEGRARAGEGLRARLLADEARRSGDAARVQPEAAPELVGTLFRWPDA